MLVTGSYVGWLIKACPEERGISSKYLQAGRLSRWRMTPYLTSEAGLHKGKYSQVYDEPISNDTAPFLSYRLCMSDPFFISCVILSNYYNTSLGYSEKDLTQESSVIDTVNYEITSRDSEMSTTWAEYIESTPHRVYDIHGKNMLLHLSKHSDRYWTPRDLKDELQLELPLNEIKRRLVTSGDSAQAFWPNRT